MSIQAPSESKQQFLKVHAHTTAQTSNPSAQGVRWKPATRIVFRFCFAYVVLFSITREFLNFAIWAVTLYYPPSLGVLWPMRQLTFLAAAHILHITATLHPTGSADTAFAWAGSFCTVVIAIISTAVWSIVDRRKQNYETLHKWLRVYLRFALASIMFFYGFIKVVPVQMPFPPLDKLVEPFGDFTPISVLWWSMGVAPIYEFFTGAAEVVGGLLLILPETTTLGALLCAADMAMVFTLDVAYDVAAKSWSLHLFLIALFLLAPDFRRFVIFFFSDRSTPPTEHRHLFQDTKRNRIALACQLLFGALLAGMVLHAEIHSWYAYGGGHTKPPLYGIWDVKEMTIDGQTHPPLLTDPARWRRVIFATNLDTDVNIQFMNDGMVWLNSQEESGNLKLRDKGPIPNLGYPGHPELSGAFQFTRPAQDELTLDGFMEGHAIHAVLKRFDLQQFPLVSHKIQWISEYPIRK